MDKLFEKYQQKISHTSTHFVRSIMAGINWESRLIGIKGARGLGRRPCEDVSKTTWQSFALAGLKSQN